ADPVAQLLLVLLAQRLEAGDLADVGVEAVAGGRARARPPAGGLLLLRFAAGLSLAGHRGQAPQRLYDARRVRPDHLPSWRGGGALGDLDVFAASRGLEPEGGAADRERRTSAPYQMRSLATRTPVGFTCSARRMPCTSSDWLTPAGSRMGLKIFCGILTLNPRPRIWLSFSLMSTLLRAIS